MTPRQRDRELLESILPDTTWEVTLVDGNVVRGEIGVLFDIEGTVFFDLYSADEMVQIIAISEVVMLRGKQ